MKQQDIKFPLRHFSGDWARFPGEHADWGNLIVYHLVEVLNHCCGSTALTLEHYDRLLTTREAWRDNRPQFMRPIYYEPVSTCLRFPVINYIGDVASEYKYPIEGVDIFIHKR
jgi:hypothetical protein